MHSTRLLKPLERRISAGHPWVYRDAVRPFQAKTGDIVTLYDNKRRFLARGLADDGALAIRLLTTQNQPIDAAFLAQRIDQALALRALRDWGQTDALRLLHGEGDRLPGLVCDRYGHYAVIKWDGLALRAWREEILDHLGPALERLGIHTIIERSGRGVDKQVTALRGEMPTEPIAINEWGMKLWVDVGSGQKTGMFLDHRESRRRLRALAKDHRVLNLFSYSGGFSVAAGLGGAREVVSVDSAAAAIALAERNWRDNNLDPAQHLGLAQEVRPYLETLGPGAFDLIVSDPPSFAPKQSVKDKALSAYFQLHRAVLKVLAPGGLLLAASCSSHVTREDFDTNLRDAARAEKRHLQVLGRWGADVDHPVPLGFAEGEYLKVLLARAD